MFDSTVQDLIRVDGTLDSKSRYKPLYWNCHDIGCRFAYLAATPDANLSLLRELSGRFERAKFATQRTLDTVVMSAQMELDRYSLYATPTTTSVPVFVRRTVFSLIQYELSIKANLPAAAQALAARRTWADILVCVRVLCGDYELLHARVSELSGLFVGPWERATGNNPAVAGDWLLLVCARFAAVVSPTPIRS